MSTLLEIWKEAAQSASFSRALAIKAATDWLSPAGHANMWRGYVSSPPTPTTMGGPWASSGNKDYAITRSQPIAATAATPAYLGGDYRYDRPAAQPPYAGPYRGAVGPGTPPAAPAASARLPAAATPARLPAAAKPLAAAGPAAQGSGLAAAAPAASAPVDPQWAARRAQIQSGYQKAVAMGGQTPMLDAASGNFTQPVAHSDAFLARNAPPYGATSGQFGNLPELAARNQHSRSMMVEQSRPMSERFPTGRASTATGLPNMVAQSNLAAAQVAKQQSPGPYGPVPAGPAAGGVQFAQNGAGDQNFKAYEAARQRLAALPPAGQGGAGARRARIQASNAADAYRSIALRNTSAYQNQVAGARQNIAAMRQGQRPLGGMNAGAPGIASGGSLAGTTPPALAGGFRNRRPG